VFSQLFYDIKINKHLNFTLTVLILFLFFVLFLFGQTYIANFNKNLIKHHSILDSGILLYESLTFTYFMISLRAINMSSTCSLKTIFYIC